MKYSNDPSYIDFECIYDEIELSDFNYNNKTEIYTYSCPCGDSFEISKDDLLRGCNVATCPSCSLKIKVIYTELEVISATKQIILRN